MWTCNLRIDVPALYQLSQLHMHVALYWQSPYFVNIFVRGGASQKSWNYILPFSKVHVHVSCPIYDTTWEEAV